MLSSFYDSISLRKKFISDNCIYEMYVLKNISKIRVHIYFSQNSGNSYETNAFMNMSVSILELIYI